MIHISRPVQLLLLATLTIAAPKLASAQTGATTPFQAEVSCTIADQGSACQADLPVPGGYLLTVQVVSAYRTGSPSGNAGVVFNTTLNNKEASFVLPMLPDASGVAVSAATLAAPIYTRGGKGTSFVIYRSAFSGVETVHIGVSGYLTPNGN